MVRRLLATVLLTAAAAAPAFAAAVPAFAAATVAQAVNPQDTSCPNNVVPGSPLTATPWPQKQLNFEAVWPVTEGRYTSSGRAPNGWSYRTGQPVTVATIDSGFDRRNPVLRGADTPRSVHKAGVTARYDDCVGHGTEVGSIIVAQPGSTYMVGVAPQARLLPIQYITAEGSHSAVPETLALKYAIDQHAQVINMSLQSPAAPTGALLAQFRRAQQEGIVIVAAGGNDNPSTGGRRAYYPAALSTQLDNIIAVSPVNQDGTVPDFGIQGRYINVAAPGGNIPVAVRKSGFKVDSGSSFAAPFVAGTVALMLAANPQMTPEQVRHRLETTADPPPGSVPDPRYGYGTINPLLAVTSNQDDDVNAPSPPARGTAIAAPVPETPPDRSLQHRALAIAFGLLGLAALTVAGAAVLRGGQRARRA